MHHVASIAWRGEALPGGARAVPEEAAIAITYNGSAHAVMMATPLDLEDFGYGFSLTEGQIERPDQILSIETVEFDQGIELRIWLDHEREAILRRRRRRLAGPTGCGLCGIESLEQALPTPPRVDGEDRIAAPQIRAAQTEMFTAQVLHAATGAVHAAGLWLPGQGIAAVREDVGRHNALDKLVGALARQGRTGAGGMLLLTSRVSVEMVQKAAVLGVPVVVAVSAPTALAIRTAEAAGITLVAIARQDGFDVFTHARRIILDQAAAP
ncbi:MAG: formate dehydrogenase accessory sulfurtransferase FdhD [Geminicoccaceae bacterium]